MNNGAKDLRYSTLSLDERILVITHGRNAMTSFENTLSDAQIHTLAEYTIQLAGQTKHAE
jgi:mono/diheme cytochrome c family protein